MFFGGQNWTDISSKKKKGTIIGHITAIEFKLPIFKKYFYMEIFENYIK